MSKMDAKGKSAGLGLDSLGDLSGLLGEPAGIGGPREIPLDLIDEDPNQPRSADNPGFSSDSIAELGETIKARGVKSPISVRENLEAPGRYIINHGARRFRAAGWAQKQTIPAFVDNDYNDADQIIENLHRNDLTAREIADFIGRGLAQGKKKGEIAREIGKSPAFVKQHATLLDLPDPIAQAFTMGRSKDVTVINELVTAYRKHPQEVETWLSDSTQELTRGTVKLLREFLESKQSRAMEPVQEHSDADAVATPEPEEKPAKLPKIQDPDKLKKAIVCVKFAARQGRLLLDRRPSVVGMAWLKYDDDGQELEADLSKVRLVSVIEG